MAHSQVHDSDQLHGYYAVQRDARDEPSALGNTVPGFGDVRGGLRQIFTLNSTHVFSPDTVNEARFGFNRISFTAVAGAPLNPADFGIRNGINQVGALPQINVAGGLNFGGPSQLPQGRGDTSFVASDTLSQLRGRHSIKFGGEIRRFYSNNLLARFGRFIFPPRSRLCAELHTRFMHSAVSPRRTVSADSSLCIFQVARNRPRTRLRYEGTESN